MVGLWLVVVQRFDNLDCVDLAGGTFQPDSVRITFFGGTIATADLGVIDRW